MKPPSECESSGQYRIISVCRLRSQNFQLSENLREYFVYCREFLGNLTEYDQGKMRAVNCAVLP